MATIRSHKNGETKQVKNLGWLLRHARDVETLLSKRLPGGRGHLTAWTDAYTYTTEFADFTLLKEFIERPSLQHASIHAESDTK